MIRLVLLYSRIMLMCNLDVWEVASPSTVTRSPDQLSMVLLILLS